MTVGVYYYPGWSTPGGGPNPAAPWSIIPASRLPLIGAYPEDQQWVCDVQLGQMAQYGIDYVAADSYWDDATDTPKGDHWLNSYLASTVPNKPKIAILWDNTSSGLTPAHFLAALTHWNAICEGQFHKIDGKPVVFIFNVPSYLQNTCGGNLSDAISLLDQARKIGNFFFVACSTDLSAGDTSPYAIGFDAVTAYNILNGPDWAAMEHGYMGYYLKCRTSPLPTILPVSAGWDSTPWGGTPIANPTPQQFAHHLAQAKMFMEMDSVKPVLGVIVEAWNEYGEGAYIEPAHDNGGTARLQAIRDTFKSN